MITRPTLVSQTNTPNVLPAETATGAAGDGRTLLSASAIRDFALGVNTALLAALAERGDDVTGLAMQRRLQAYAAPRVAASAKLRRYA